MDVTIYRRKHLAYVVGDSEKGKKWLEENMTTPRDKDIFVLVDYVMDLARNLQLEGLDVEIK